MKSTAFKIIMTLWLIFLFSPTTDADTDLPWKNKEYSAMQNITNVIGESHQKYFVYKATFDTDVLIKENVTCLIMKISDYSVFDTVAFRKYRKPEDPPRKSLTDFSLYLITKKDTGYDVDNYMNVLNEYFTPLEDMHLVYTDYTSCALLFHDETEDYELWLYQRPDGVATICELLLATASDKLPNVYYMDSCPTF